MTLSTADSQKDARKKKLKKTDVRHNCGEQNRISEYRTR